MTKKRIAIKGAGFAGSYMAYLLGKEGHEVDVFEKRKDGKLKPCGDIITSPGELLHISDNEASELFAESISLEFDEMKIIIGDRPPRIFQENTAAFDKCGLTEQFRSQSDAGFHYGASLSLDWADTARFKDYDFLIDCSGSHPKQRRALAVRRIRPCNRGEGTIPEAELRPGLQGYRWKWKENNSEINEGVGTFTEYFDRDRLSAFFDFTPPIQGAYVPMVPQRDIVSNGVINFGDSAGMISPTIAAGNHHILNFGPPIARYIEGKGSLTELNNLWRWQYRYLKLGQLYQTAFIFFLDHRLYWALEKSMEQLYKKIQAVKPKAEKKFRQAQ